MRVLKSYPIKNKLIAIIMMTSSVALLLAGAAFIINSYFVTRGDMVQGLSVQAEVIGSNTAAALAFGDEESAIEILAALNANSHFVFACIFDKSRRVFAAYARDDQAGNFPVPAYQEEGSRFEGRYLLVFKPIVLGDEALGTVCVQTDFLGPVISFTLLGVVGVVIILLISSCVAFIMSSRLQRIISRPIARLAGTAKAISQKKDYSIRVEKENHDELGFLVDGFNEMLTQIEDREAELNLHRNHLQEQVAQRTAELERANKELREEMAERKEAEEEKERMAAKLLHAQKMEAIGTLAGGVAHDLNNILSALVGYPELLLMDLPEDSRLRKPMLTIYNSGLKAAAIVQDLLTLARRGLAVKEVVSLNDIISDFQKSPEYEKLMEAHPDVKIEMNLDSHLMHVLGSHVHLSKTVMNLIFNGAEAMPGGGKMTISTSNQYIDTPLRCYEDVQEGEYILLSVADTGVGIPPEDLSRIFEPFYSKKEVGKSGTGLGMAVVWGTVKDHKGYIDVQSIEGKGSKFDLFFPVTRQSPSKKRGEVAMDEYMGNESILVIDDVEEQRRIASQVLTKLGYSVTTAESGENAVEYLKTLTADLIVLDMIMDPGIDGLETYKRILQLHPEQKAVIASGYSETESVKETQRLGAGTFIQKPYVMETIGLAVRYELDKKTVK